MLRRKSPNGTFSTVLSYQLSKFVINIPARVVHKTEIKRLVNPDGVTDIEPVKDVAHIFVPAEGIGKRSNLDNAVFAAVKGGIHFLGYANSLPHIIFEKSRVNNVLGIALKNLPNLLFGEFL